MSDAKDNPQLDLLGGELPLSGSAAPKKSAPEKTMAAVAPKESAPVQPALNVSHASQDDELEDDEKAPNAFRTISEVASLLSVPQHVLRFWESRFSQIKPLKMRGGRRYYRPEDVDTLTTVHNLLYKQGYTIKGAKKVIGQLKSGKKETPALESKTSVAAVAAVPAPVKSGISDKQMNQLTVIRQELIAMRDSLKPHLKNAAHA